jgi:glycolate oxidase
MAFSLPESALKRLIEDLGTDTVFCGTSIDTRYCTDKTSDFRAAPDIVLLPRTTEEVSKALRICHAFRIPVIPRGAGTGVTGGAVATSGGAILSLERMNNILDLDEKNSTITVQPGVTTENVQKKSMSAGLFYPPDPASLHDCTIGGNVAESSGGPRAVKYGTTKDYILGLEFVTVDGTVMRSGGKYVKNATGYNLTGLLTGSEGTLAVITEIILRLVPAPKESCDILASFDSLDSAAEAVYLISAARIIPATIEFMEEDAIRFVARNAEIEIPMSSAKAHLLIQIDGESKGEIRRKRRALIQALNPLSPGIITARNEEMKATLWSARRGIRPAIEKESPIFLAEDCVVPRAEIPAFVSSVKQLLNRRGLKSVIFGHAGDGNVHIDVLKYDIPYEEWLKLLPDLKKEIYACAISHGGTISGEHGIGSVRKNYMDLAFSSAELSLMKQIKKAFDPEGLLNPGKMI